MTELDRAIAYTEEARRTHVESIAWIEEHRSTSPRMARAVIALEGAGVTFHRQCVREYDLILRVLRRMQSPDRRTNGDS